MKFSWISWGFQWFWPLYLHHYLAKKKDKNKFLWKLDYPITEFKTYFHYDHVAVSARHNIALHIVAKPHRYHCTSLLHSKLCLSVCPTNLIICFLMQTEGFYEFLRSIKEEGDRGAVPRTLVPNPIIAAQNGCFSTASNINVAHGNPLSTRNQKMNFEPERERVLASLMTGCL
jgi:hypothetical protein